MSDDDNVIHLNLRKPPELIEYSCPECEGESFLMYGYDDYDSDVSNVIKLICSECEARIDGYFYWVVEGED